MNQKTPSQQPSKVPLAHQPAPWPIEIRLPASVILKLVVAVGLVAALIKLAPLLMLVALALLVAVTLLPVLDWFECKGAPRWAGIAVIVLGLAASLTLFLAVIFPSLIDQLSTFAKDLPRYRDQLLAQVPAGSVLRKPAERYLHGEGAPSTEQWIGHAMSAGQVVAGGVFSFLLLLVTAVYFVIDGPRFFAWLLDYFSPSNRRRLRQTGNEVSEVVFAYVAGQAITSLLVFVCTFVVLRLLHVPAPLTLAVLAGVFDVLPVLGFFLMAAPAALLGLTVSPGTALAVTTYCVAYHLVENYFIVPKVYGSRLRLSTLAVLLSLLAADLIAGIPGAILALPVVASYPIIERIWLGPWLGRATLERHAAKDEAAVKSEAEKRQAG